MRAAYRNVSNLVLVATATFAVKRIFLQPVALENERYKAQEREVHARIKGAIFFLKRETALVYRDFASVFLGTGASFRFRSR